MNYDFDDLEDYDSFDDVDDEYDDNGDELDDIDELGNMHLVEEGGDDLDDESECLIHSWRFMITPLTVKPYDGGRKIISMKDPTFSKVYSFEDIAVSFYFAMIKGEACVEKKADLTVGHSYNQYEIIHTVTNSFGEEKLYEIPYSCFVQTS